MLVIVVRDHIDDVTLNLRKRYVLQIRILSGIELREDIINAGRYMHVYHCSSGCIQRHIQRIVSNPSGRRGIVSGDPNRVNRAVQSQWRAVRLGTVVGGLSLTD